MCAHPYSWYTSSISSQKDRLTCFELASNRSSRGWYYRKQHVCTELHLQRQKSHSESLSPRPWRWPKRSYVYLNRDIWVWLATLIWLGNNGALLRMTYLRAAWTQGPMTVLSTRTVEIVCTPCQMWNDHPDSLIRCGYIRGSTDINRDSARINNSQY